MRMIIHLRLYKMIEPVRIVKQSQLIINLMKTTFSGPTLPTVCSHQEKMYLDRNKRVRPRLRRI